MQCSLFTIRRRLRENGNCHHIPAQKELLREHHKEQRMAFALEHFNWNDEWMTTIFQDEKVLSTDENGKVTLWKMKGTRYAQENVRFRERSGRITLGFWGCISSHVSGPLVRITPHINSEEIRPRIIQCDDAIYGEDIFWHILCEFHSK